MPAIIVINTDNILITIIVNYVIINLNIVIFYKMTILKLTRLTGCAKIQLPQKVKNDYIKLKMRILNENI